MKPPKANEDHLGEPAHSTIEIENGWLDEVERRIRLQDAGLIDDIDAEDIYRELRERLR